MCATWINKLLGFNFHVFCSESLCWCINATLQKDMRVLWGVLRCLQTWTCFREKLQVHVFIWDHMPLCTKEWTMLNTSLFQFSFQFRILYIYSIFLVPSWQVCKHTVMFFASFLRDWLLVHYWPLEEESWNTLQGNIEIY